MRGARTIASTLLAVALSACAAVSRPATTVPALIAEGPAVSAANDAVRDSVIARLARRAVLRGDDTLDLLLLSGGGQHGAFGAGFLRGWASRDVDPMPRFDLVSGISTGSLQAPFALLGTPAALDTIAALYRAAVDRIAPTFDWWFWIRRTGGIVNTSRSERSLRTTVTPALRAQLQVEFDAGRQLLTATTDMDLGIGRLWDVAAVLGRDDASLTRALTVLYSATAIPGIFPPRVIDGHVHSDGGIIANVLPILELADYRALARQLRAAGATRPVHLRLWVIMNLWTHAPPRVVKPHSRGAISARSTEVLFWAAQPMALRRLEELARAVSADVPGLTLDVRIAAPPASLATEPGADKLFDKAWMQRLEQLGYAQARGPSPWDSTRSSYTRPPGR
jgi:predicted acylesterase/phospholipase RssA